MKRILLVEDDFYIRGLYRRAFEKKGYSVTEAQDGESALKVLTEEEFDIVVLDLMLPGTPGIQVLENITKMVSAPIYILSNVGDETVLKRARELGAKAYFTKVNYTPKQLVVAIEEKEAASS